MLKAKNYGYDLVLNPIYKKCLYKIVTVFLEIGDRENIDDYYQRQFDIGDLDKDGVYEIVILGMPRTDIYGEDASDEKYSQMKVYKFLEQNTENAGIWAYNNDRCK